jgi:hypothetical protein
MINEEHKEINANIKKKPDCTQHALCHCLCHGDHVSGPIAKHVVACCYKCEICGLNVVFEGKPDK